MFSLLGVLWIWFCRLVVRNVHFTTKDPSHKTCRVSGKTLNPKIKNPTINRLVLLHSTKRRGGHNNEPEGGGVGRSSPGCSASPIGRRTC